MNTQKEDINRKLNIIANHYGYEPQSRMCMEECAELIQAINKYHRASESGDIQKMFEAREQVAEEMADVQIMLLQMEIFLFDDRTMLNVIDKKLDRQIKRIMSNRSRLEED